MYAPDFILAITAAVMASRYIKASLELETIAYKFSPFIVSIFELENAEALKSAAEAFMCSISTADIHNVDTVVLNYQYNKFTLKPNGKIQNLAPYFPIKFKGLKKDSHPRHNQSSFQSFCLQNQTERKYTCLAGWSLRSQTSNNFYNGVRR